MGKAAIYNPYLDTLGGGERYTLSFAKVLAEEGFKVDIQWKEKSIKEKIQARFGIKLDDRIDFIDDIKRGENYDTCFWVSDGSIPTLRSRSNFIHFQVPFKDVDGKTLLNKMKLFRVKKIICNSKFTKKVIDKEYGVNSLVIYPPVDLSSLKPKRKEKTILYVGRFSNLVQSKSQDVLINSFKNLVKEKFFQNYKLILAGGVEIGVGDYLNKLKKSAGNYNIEFIESPDFKTLKEIYGKAKFFWSAAGFNVNEINNPEKVEHFGITLIESMAAGCVPIVYNAGGYKEIITSGENGYLWKNKRDLIKITKEVIETSGLYKNISTKAKKSSGEYDYEVFKINICQILS
ncbi:MAG: glycosyltransferase family 4 protein [bacterium]|nr:glycosyltransferase family 4 protein [bacterium]